jgi:hypothetical protein
MAGLNQATLSVNGREFAMNAVNTSWIVAAVATSLVTAASIPGFAPYTTKWYTLHGGGGVSTGGAFAVRGTIGQLDAGTSMSGGVFSATGGVQTMLAIQAPGAPADLVGKHTNTRCVHFSSFSEGLLSSKGPHAIRVSYSFARW